MRARRREGEGMRLVCLRGAGICLREAVLCECLPLCFGVQCERSGKIVRRAQNHKIRTLSMWIRCWSFQMSKETHWQL